MFVDPAANEAYVADGNGKPALQRFVFKGERPVTRAEQRAPWPRR